MNERAPGPNPETTNRVLACPFCGEFPDLTRDKTKNPRHRRVTCVNKICPVRPSTEAAPMNTAVQNWNRRLAGSGPDIREAARGGGAEWVPLPILRKLGHAAQALPGLLRSEPETDEDMDAHARALDVAVPLATDPELATWLDVAVQRCLLDAPGSGETARGVLPEWVPLPVLRKLGQAAQVLRYMLLRASGQLQQGDLSKHGGCPVCGGHEAYMTNPPRCVQCKAVMIAWQGEPILDVGIIHDPELATWLDVAVRRCLLDAYPPRAIVTTDAPGGPANDETPGPEGAP